MRRIVLVHSKSFFDRRRERVWFLRRRRRNSAGYDAQCGQSDQHHAGHGSLPKQVSLNLSS